MQCIICGKKMISTTGGNYHCPTCGHAVNDLLYRHSNWNETSPQEQRGQKGWICPVCGRGVAPHMSYCPCKCDLKITYSSSSLANVSCDQATTTDINAKLNECSIHTEEK